MPEELEEKRSGGTDLGYVRDVVRRRHLYFLIPLFVAWLLVWGASWLIPPRYKSSTLILVQEPTMPQDYVAPNISDDMQARLESMKQQVLSRTRLLMIIDKLHLYNAGHDQAAQDAQVAAMSKDISIELVRDQRSTITAFRISYEANDPRLAQQVDGELKDLFIDENSRARLEASEGTTSFIEKQLADASADLAAQEAKVRAFEAEHEGDLPTQEAGNLQILGGLQSQLQNEQSSLDAARQQHVYLQAMIEQERAAQAKGIVTGTEPAGTGSMSDLAYVNQQLAAMKAHLSELSSHYTDKYPDVQALKVQIAKTEAIRDNLLAAAAKKGPDGKEDASGSMSPAMRQLQGQLQANQLEIANREAAINDLKNRIASYQGRLNAEPGTEQELAELTRGYDQSKANYDDLLKKREQSTMATNMEQLQQGERFTMLDPPNLPVRPDFPDHLRFCGIGVGVGLALGFLIAGGFEFLDDRLFREAEIKTLLPIPIISEVPEIVTEQDTQKAKKSLVLGWATTAVVFTAILAGSLFSYLRQ